MNNALALAIKPMQVDVATPLMTASRLRQAETEARANEFQLRQAAVGAEARGLMPFANRPEFAQKWAESVDRLHGQGILDDRSAAQWRGNPSPLVLQSIIAQTSSPELQFRMREAERAQKNVDRDFALRAESAREKPTIQVIEGPDGKKQIVRIEPFGRGARVINPEGMAAESANPFAMGKLSEAQSKDALYANRMLSAEKVFQEPVVSKAGQSPTQVGLSKLPGAGTYYNLNSAEFQKFEQAKRDFVNAVLRRESGAVISEQEFANAERQYFPRPGDSAEVLVQKAANRREAIKGIGAGAGPSFRPNFSFDESGKLIDHPRAKAAQSSAAKRVATKAEYDALPPGTTYMAPDGSQRIKQ